MQTLSRYLVFLFIGLMIALPVTLNAARVSVIRPNELHVAWTKAESLVEYLKQKEQPWKIKKVLLHACVGSLSGIALEGALRACLSSYPQTDLRLEFAVLGTLLGAAFSQQPDLYPGPAVAKIRANLLCKARGTKEASFAPFISSGHESDSESSHLQDEPHLTYENFNQYTIFINNHQVALDSELGQLLLIDLSNTQGAEDFKNYFFNPDSKFCIE